MTPTFTYFRSHIRRTSALLATPLLSGCVVGEAINKQRQLDRVARDWCQTIRASQVIPIYPLDEDVQPGAARIVPPHCDI